jgi:CRP-like cAMP-binding protein
VLIGQDDRDLDVYIVAAGELEVRIDGVHVATLRAGDLVGEMAMLGNGRRTATVTASTSARVLALDPRDLDDALAAVPGAAEAFARRTVL